MGPWPSAVVRRQRPVCPLCLEPHCVSLAATLTGRPSHVCPVVPQVWSLEQPGWHCRIDEGSAGLAASCWSPDGRHILNTTEFHVSHAPAPEIRELARVVVDTPACGRGLSVPGGRTANRSLKSPTLHVKG